MTDATDAEQTARRLVIQGRVQGVWFRAWTVQEATALGLSGWVRNRADRSVEAHLQGPAPAVAEMERRCHDGPPLAQVRRVDARQAAWDTVDGFSQAPSV